MGCLRVVEPVMGTAEGDEVFDLILSA
ncbi:MAG: hypothetical protein JWQ35_2385, partial [Bacteriovoracaceae bacterium]|nr:hypothetical protein [Bacteriovoracaceae bacterium]